MIFAIGAVRCGLLAAEVEAGLPGISDRPLAHSLSRACDRMVGALDRRGTGRQSKSVSFTDDCVTRDVAEMIRNLACA